MTAPTRMVGMVLVAVAVGCHAPADPLPPRASAWTLPLPDAGYNVREGRALFQHYCSICHGAEGHGDGFNAYNLDPKPRDLGAADFQAKRSDEELAAAIRSGGGASGLSASMPPWGRSLGERQLRNLVLYLRTLSPEPQ